MRKASKGMSYKRVRQKLSNPLIFCGCSDADEYYSFIVLQRFTLSQTAITDIKAVKSTFIYAVEMFVNLLLADASRMEEVVRGTLLETCRFFSVKIFLSARA
jgi:hypothetical protein